MQTTLNKIRAHQPCKTGWEKLLKNLGKTRADDEPLLITTILDSNGLDDALWCLRAVEGHEREMRLFAAGCARSVQHLMIDKRSISAIDVAERYANGEATDQELINARAAAEAARDAALAAAGAARDAAGATGYAAWCAASAAEDAKDAAEAAALNTVWTAAGYAAGDAARAARDATESAAGSAKWDAAKDAVCKIQADYLRVVCMEIETRGEE